MNDASNVEGLVEYMVVTGTWFVLLTAWIGFVIYQAIKVRREYDERLPGSRLTQSASTLLAELRRNRRYQGKNARS